MIREWILIAIHEDGMETRLNDVPFVGDVFDAGNMVDALASDMDGIESFVLQSGPITRRNDAVQPT